MSPSMMFLMVVSVLLLTLNVEAFSPLGRPALKVSNSALNAKASGGLFQKKNIPVFGITVGTMALCVQLFILFPWHPILKQEFAVLEQVTKEEVEEDQKLESKLDNLIKVDMEILRKLSLKK